MQDGTGIRGQVTIRLIGPNGNIKHEETIKNLITTAGDQYYAEAGADGVAGFSKSKADPTGMKLGTGTTAATKSGVASALVTYETASNQLFTTNASSVSAVGTDVGYKIAYSCTWPAGDVTETALTEAVIVNDAGTDLTSSAANTYARVVFSAINKGASDSLVINWTHTFLAT